jgi:hypothetical protein
MKATTFKIGLIFSCLITLCLLLFAYFAFWQNARTTPLIALFSAGSILLVGLILVRCRVCGKSAFVTEVLPEEKIVHLFVNVIRPVPERACSRCGGDLSTQSQF